MGAHLVLLHGGDGEEVREPDVSGRLRAVESGQHGLLSAFGEHEQHDERRFTEIRTGMEAGLGAVRAEIATLSRAITEAISGDSRTEGLRERVRTMETTMALREADLRWLKRTILATALGLIASVISGCVLFFVNRGGH